MIAPVLATELKYFLADYLPRQQNASRLTILAYRDSLKLLLTYVARAKKTPIDRLTFAEIDRIAVLQFLEAIERERHNAVTTRNARLTAIRSFFRSVATRHPDHLEASAQVLGIPTKRADNRAIDCLTLDEVNAILQTIDLPARNGRRDDALIRFMHNTGARVQEALDVLASDLRLDTPAHVHLRGKECHAYCISFRRRGETTGTHAGRQACDLAFSAADVLPVVRRGIGVGPYTDAHGAGRVAPISEPWAA